MDVSNWSGEVMDWQVISMRAHGIERVIVQTLNPPQGYPKGVTREQIITLRRGGMPEIESYVYLWWSQGANGIRQKLDILDGLDINRVWLDVEDVSPIPSTWDQIIQDSLDAIRTRGYRTGIYTARWYCESYLGGSNRFAQEDLWVAQYDGQQNLAFNKFGGWDSCVMKQHFGDVNYAGVPSCDLNYYEYEAPTLPPPPVNIPPRGYMIVPNRTDVPVSTIESAVVGGIMGSNIARVEHVEDDPSAPTAIRFYVTMPRDVLARGIGRPDLENIIGHEDITPYLLGQR